MTESPSPNNHDDTGTPRWVRVFGIISLVVVLVFVTLLLAGGGRHGPRRHSPPSSDKERGVQQP